MGDRRSSSSLSIGLTVCCGVVSETGIEPVTPDLEGRCSIQLSYSLVLRGVRMASRGPNKRADAS